MRAGDLRKTARFLALVRTEDGSGGAVETWQAALVVRCQLSPVRAREAIQAGRLASAAAAVLRIRSSSASRSITARDRVEVDGVTYNIRSIVNPDGRNVMLEMGVETDGL